MHRTKWFMVVVTGLLVTAVWLHALVSRPMIKALAAAQAPAHHEDQNQEDAGIAVLCQVAGGGLILSIVPEGTMVKTGDLLCELDSFRLKDRLTKHQIAVKQSENESTIGQLAHQAAIVALKVYEEGSYPQDKASLQCDVKRAEINLATTSDHVDEVRRLFEKGTISNAHKVAAELSLKETRFALELAQNKLQILESVTRPNTVKRLSSEVERSHAQEVAAKEILELRRAQAERTRQQLEHCRITAPCDGRVAYVSLASGGNVHEGYRVHEREWLLSILPPSP